MTGSRGDAYAAELSAEGYDDKPAVRMWRDADGDDGFGAMCQLFKAASYHGKRVRFSAALRTVDVTGRAALCVRVDGPNGKSDRPLAFDNMDTRARINGTTAWSRHACVVDVPPEATAIFISNILSGRGELFWADVRFETVDESVPVTDMNKTYAVNEQPRNLDFSEA